MLRPTTVTLNEETLKEIDRHSLSKSLSRSAITRIALQEFLSKSEKSSKEEKEEKTELVK